MATSQEQTSHQYRIIYNNTQKCVQHSRSIKNIRNSAIHWFICNCGDYYNSLRPMSDPQCGSIRKTGINFKSKEIWRYDYRGGTIRESDTIRENTVLVL